MEGHPKGQNNIHDPRLLIAWSYSCDKSWAPGSTWRGLLPDCSIADQTLVNRRIRY